MFSSLDDFQRWQVLTYLGRYRHGRVAKIVTAVPPLLVQSFVILPEHDAASFSEKFRNRQNQMKDWEQSSQHPASLDGMGVWKASQRVLQASRESHMSFFGRPIRSATSARVSATR